MAEGEFVDLNDPSEFEDDQERLNCTKNSALSDVQDGLVIVGRNGDEGLSEAGNSSQNSTGIENLDGTSSTLTGATEQQNPHHGSPLKRQNRVSVRRKIVAKDKRNESMDVVEATGGKLGCDDTHFGENGEETIAVEFEVDLVGGDDVVTKRDSKVTRESRNSAGASGGVFGEDFCANYEGLEAENVEELAFEEENCEMNPQTNQKPEGTEPEDFTDIDSHHILSFGGDDRNARRAIVFSACRLPPKNSIDHQKLFRYMKHALDQYVENDYSVVYFHHGLNSRNKPSLSWVVQVYQELDRKYKKNLKALYVVHPSNFIKVLWNVLKPLISAKFGKKVMYVNRLSELKEHVHIDQLDIPQLVKLHDEQLCARDKPKYPPAVFHTPLVVTLPETQQLGVSLESILNKTGDEIPLLMRTCIEFLKKSALDVEGIFRRSANVSTVRNYGRRFNTGEAVVFVEEQDVHVAAVLLKKFLRELPEPLMTFELYNEYMRIHTLPEHQRVMEVRQVLKSRLPKQNYVVLVYLMSFLSQVTEHSIGNKMNSANLAIVFGPNLMWTRSAAASLSDMGPINATTKLLIDNYTDVFQEGT